MKNLSCIIALLSMGTSLFLSSAAWAVKFNFVVDGVVQQKVDVFYLMSTSETCRQSFYDDKTHSQIVRTLTFSSQAVGSDVSGLASDTKICLRMTTVENEGPEYYGPITLGDALYSFEKKASSDSSYSLDGLLILFAYNPWGYVVDSSNTVHSPQ